MYPGYLCFKDVEKKHTDKFREWLVYWLVLAAVVVVELIGDRFLFWLPMYYEAKVALVICLWHPKTKGALFVYDSFLLPFLQVGETILL